MWSNPSIRAPTAPTNPGAGAGAGPRQTDDFDHFRIGNRAQTNTTEDFPPLGGDERRSNLLSSFSNQQGMGLQQASRLVFDHQPELGLRPGIDRNVGIKLVYYSDTYISTAHTSRSNID